MTTLPSDDDSSNAALPSWPQPTFAWATVPGAPDDPGASIGATVVRVAPRQDDIGTVESGAHRDTAIVRPSDEDTGSTDSMLRVGLHAASNAPSPHHTAKPHEDSFTIRKLVAAGGCGEVWMAIQNSLRRVVALKAIRGTMRQSTSPKPADSEAVERAFMLEAMTTAQLEHPNIVPVYDFGSDERGMPVMAMKLVRGEAWDVVLQRDFEALPVDDYLQKHLGILLSMMQAVAFAHSRGVVHRDLKPSQVMLGEFGEVLLMDWGLAVAVPDNADATPDERQRFVVDGIATIHNAANPCGTPCYMAPEQTVTSAAGISIRTDVYLLGGTLYHILTGRVPRRSGNVHETMRLAQSGVVIPMEEAAPGRYIPGELQRIAMRALSVSPGARHSSILEMMDEIRAYLSGASNRSQSDAIVDAIAARFDALLRAIGSADSMPSEAIYAECSECISELNRAAVLWARNQRVDLVRAAVLDLYTDKALNHGDLMLARGLVTLMPDGARRDTVVAIIQQKELQQQRQRIQRRLMIYGLIVLLALHGLGSYLYVSLQYKAKERLEEERDVANVARSSAEHSREAAERARATAEDARRAAAELQAKAEHDQYFASIWAADANIESQRGENAIHLLMEETKPDLRRWEWGLLARRAMGDRYGIAPVNFVASVAFSPDNTRIYSGSRDGSVHFWDSATGRYSGAWAYFASRLYEVKPSPDGSRLLLTSFEGLAEIVDARTGEVQQRLAGHTKVLRGCAWSPDGKRVATTSFDKTVRIWDAVTGKIIRVLSTFNDTTNGCQFGADGDSLLVFTDDGTASIWNLTSATLAVNFSDHKKSIPDAKFSEDYSLVVTACADGALRIFDAVTGELKRSISFENSTPYATCFLQGNKYVCTVLEDGMGAICDVETGARRTKFLGEGLPRELYVSPDKRFLAVAGRFFVRLHSLATLLDEPAPLPAAPYIQGLKKADVRIPVYGVTQGRDPFWHEMEKPWNVAAGMTVLSTRGRTIAAESHYTTFSPDGRFRFDIDSTSYTGRATECATGRVVWTPPNAKLAMAAFSPDGKTLAVVNPVDKIYIVDVETWSLRCTLSRDPQARLSALDRYLVAHATFSPDSRYLAVPYLNGHMINWDTTTGKVVSETEYTYGLGACATFNATGQHILVGHNDDRLSIWDAATGKLVRMMRGHTMPVCGVTYSPDNTRIVSFARDRTVRLWDAESGREIMLVMTTPTGKLPVGAQFTPDGKTLIVLVNDGTVVVHDTMPWNQTDYPTDAGTSLSLSQRIELYNRRQLLGPQVTADDVTFIPTVPTARFTSASVSSVPRPQ